MLDGSIAFRDERPLPFSALQQRIGRQKQVAQMSRAIPVFMTYDILEHEGVDVRQRPLHERRAAGVSFASGVLRVSPIVDDPAGWAGLAAQRANSRALGVEGLMIKRARPPTALAARRGTGGSGRSIPTPSTPS